MAIDKQNIENIYPLTPLQEGFLFHSLSRQDDSYIQQIAYLLKGRFNYQRFVSTWKFLFDRHAVLRTLFSYAGAEQPLQVVLKQRSPEFEDVDLSQLSATEQLQRREQLKLRDRNRGFHLNRDCLMRFTLLHLGDDLTEVIWTHHHIILDGWSLGILLAECTALYQSIDAELEPVTPFSNYVNWLQKKDEQQSLEFWQQYLADYRHFIKLPYTVQSLNTQGQRQRYSFQLPEALFRGIRQLSKRLEISVNSILHGVWGILLAQYNSVEDVVFGSTVSGRPAGIEGIEHIIGLFINTIPVRVGVSPELTISELLTQIQQQAILAEPHHYSPLSTIQSRHPLQNRLLSTHVTLENFPLDERFKSLDADQHAELNVQDMEIIERTHYSLDIQFLPVQYGMSVRMAYSSEYQADMGQLIERHLYCIMQQLIENPELKLSAVSITDEQTRRDIIRQSQTAQRQFTFHSLLQRFQAAVFAAPDAIALQYGDHYISYAQLDCYTDALCQQLYTHDLHPGDYVGLCFERSIDMVVSILAVLKAGMVYVPMEPSLPLQRLEFMAQDSAIKLLLTNVEDTSRLQSLAVQTVSVCVAELDTLSQPTRFQWQPASDSPAYVIYTSGSTGQPKGVLVSHGNMARLFSAADTLFEFSDNDVWCLFHSYAFDFSVWEIWGALAYGARLVIVPYWISRSPQDFHALLEDSQVTVLNQTPTAFRYLIDADLQSESRLTALRYIVFGGETLEFKQLAPWFQRYGGSTELINMYGITETTVHVTFKQVTPELLQTRTSLIGKPLPDLSVCIVDRYGQLTAPGVPGELYVGGAGVCLGYLNRPELSAQRFLRLPGVQDDERFFYRTGDCGRYLANGELEYLGRLDQQVQFHGFRVELGEIEQALLSDSQIEQAVVIMHENQDGQQSLVAYYSTNSMQPQLTDQLRSGLAGQLPGYMIPAQFVHIQQFPLTGNGKVNRQALPTPETYLEASAVEVETPEQQVLLEAWQHVLRQNTIGIQDDFFALGGDSIQAIRVVSRLRKHDYHIEIQDVFQFPTIESLAVQIKPVTKQKKAPHISGPIHLSPVQHWFFEQQTRHAHHFNQTALLQAKNGSWQIAQVKTAWSHIVQQHAALRTCFRSQHDDIQAHIEASDQFEIDVECLSLMQAHDIEATMINHASDLQRQFVLSQAPLIRLVVYRCPDADRLLIIIHHLLVDGVSWRIILEDFANLYASLCAGELLDLQDCTDSYGNWTQHLQDYSQQPALLAELPYWTKQISHQSQCYWRGVGCEYRDARTEQLRLTVIETRHLLQQANHAYNTTTEDLLLAAMMIALESWSGLTRVVLLMEGHGREPLHVPVDVNRTVGWFTALYPFAIEKVAGRGLGYQIKAIKEGLRRIPNKGTGFGVLRYLTSKSLLSGQSLEFSPDMVFNYLGRFDAQDQSGLYRVLRNDAGASVAAQGRRPCALEFSAMVIEDQFCIDWRYDKQLFTTHSMHSLSDLYHAALQQVIVHCLQQTAPVLTPSDLTYRELELDELDALRLSHSDNISEISPLTPMQQGMWYQALREPQSTAYHEQVSFSLHGEMNSAVYQKSWDMLVDRHAILRTVFSDDQSHDPVQITLKQINATFVIEDWSEWPDSDTQRQLTQLLDSDLHTRFDLTAKPPLRIRLIKLDHQRWHLLWSFHHIILDGWSVAVLMDEMARIYHAISQQRLPQLPLVPRFSDYLHWLQKQDTETARLFWQKYNEGYTELATLPDCGGQQNATAAELVQSLSADLADNIQTAAREYKVTVNVLLQAAWGIVLARYNDSQDVMFATVVSGRPSAVANIEQMVGLLINAVPVRVCFDHSESVSALLSRLHQHNSASQSFQYLPIAETQPAQGAPDHLLVFENYGVHSQDSGQSETVPLVTEIRSREQTDYDLTWVMNPGQPWKLTCLYNNGRYSEQYIQQVAEHFMTVLQALTQSGNQSVGDLKVIAAAEQSRLTQLACGLVNELPNCGLAQLFEDTVRRYPARTALRGASVSYSYQQLNDQVNHLARRLVAAGVTPGQIIAVVLPRDCMCVVSVLAVIKTGAAYLGIEQDTPAMRINHLCKDAGVQLIIGQTQETVISTELSVFDPYTENLISDHDQTPLPQVNSSAIAYISYTSGSTGEPKGVCVSQRNVIRLVKHCNYLDIQESDTFLQFAPLPFDASTLEIWAPLLNGAELTVIEQPQPGLRQLGSFIKQYSVSTLWLTAGLFQQMVDHQLNDLAGVRQLLAGGDVVSSQHVRRLLERFPGMTFINGYGPTENTTFSCCQVVTENTAVAAAVPIGTSINNSQAWVLDSQLRLQPVGAIGELYVGGSGVAYGYWNKPGQTASQFIPHPFSADPGQRLYRTGDLVSLRADGCIEFLGRADQQFKIRGYRVEAQEIESAIKQLDAIQDARINVVMDKTGDKSLVAYVIVRSDQVFAADQFSAALAEQLPAYLIPDLWLELNEFPLNKNGKVNQALLPDPFQRNVTTLRVAPTNDSERTLLLIWQQVLSIDNISVTDDFFQLGGHSLKATRIVSLIRKQLGVEVPLKTIFEAPTIMALAAKLQILDKTDQAAPKLVKRDRSKHKVV
ncbi:MAG: amino acid adenylation domain-containing protein [Gammaproteobacteria bacterium]|nr:amino acid adenylation domain-containing protein [Gammaproteobacteria bacterium]